jgi:hypothetical protein
MSPSVLLLLFFVSLNLTPSLALIPHRHANSPSQKSPIIASSTNQLSRSMFFQWLGVGAGLTLTAPTLPAVAFEFGVSGGLMGKTKQGVELWDAGSTPIPNAQVMVSAELASSSGKPILVSFKSPWLLSKVGSDRLQARDLRSSETLFVQVLAPLDPKMKNDWQTPSQFKQLLLDSILALPEGQFGSPTEDIKVEALQDTSTFQITIPKSSYEREERQLWIEPKAIDKDTLVLLVVGTTGPRFASQQAAFQKVVDSFTAVAAPTSPRI